ncbi:Glyoxalase/bleomycin resistance protein/dioxygenase [Streptococcus varani]|jgi:lactoylglutathione lyase|uniref:Glyoxalase/bleomycin resistance protein/dioxygenase n=1 Tax=Streptococcus varani TaxID=1608583 RepID=A0A0E3WFE9_9STRE|nr:VOC family protein [Streptococcus varani]CQR25389.1 Glyoxalase/bleomycin resistance protein/dioxygenase [Streptococcus varani]
MKIEHIALYVRDLEGAKAFFEEYFAARSNQLYHNPKTGFSSYFLTFQDGARLEIMNKPSVDQSDLPVERLGFIHLAFSLGSKEKVDLLTERMKADGYELLSGPRTTGDGYYESCLLAFEGNMIELTV